MLDLVNGSTRFIGDLLEAYPDEHSTGDMIANNASAATLATGQTSQLFAFAVKLFNLGTPAPHFLCGRGPILSDLIGNEVFRVPGRERKAEKFHLMTGRKTAQMHQAARSQFSLRPQQPIYSVIGFGLGINADQAIVFDGAIVNLAQLFDVQNHVFGRIPAIHQHHSAGQLFELHRVGQHLPQMVEFALVVNFRGKDPVIDDPELVGIGIDIHASHHPNAIDDPFGIAAPLLAAQLDFRGEVFVEHHIIKDEEPIGTGDQSRPNLFPNQARLNMFTHQVAIDRIVAELLGMFRKMGQGVIDLTAQQKLAVVQPGYFPFRSRRRHSRIMSLSPAVA